MTRDSMRQKIYDAEHEVKFYRSAEGGSVDFYGSTLVLPRVRKFGDLEGVQRYVAAVYDLDVVRLQYAHSRGVPEVRARRGDRMAHYSPARHEIAIPDHRGSQNSWAMDEFTVLHEIAHSLTCGDAHGLKFVHCFLELLGVALGPEWQLLMVRALDSRGVPTC